VEVKSKGSSCSRVGSSNNVSVRWGQEGEEKSSGGSLTKEKEGGEGGVMQK
jgi:hypothetical protein